MKARVKATGEIVEVVKDGPFYNAIDVEFIFPKKINAPFKPFEGYEK